MAVTRSRAAERTPGAHSRSQPRTAELCWLLAVSVVVAAGMAMVYRAKTFGVTDSSTQLNLNRLSGLEQVLPYLTFVPSGAERQYLARRIYNSGGDADVGPAENVGRLARLRASADEIRRNRGLTGLQKRLKAASKEAVSIPLLSREQFHELKRVFVVRGVAQFTRSFFLWAGLLLAGFFAVHFWWRMRDFRGDQYLLPALLLLCGIGFSLMAGLRDPLRDSLMFSGFAQGVIGGCVILAAASALDWQRLTGGLSFVPLLASFLLSAALVIFGTGPGASDAKVNLFGTQPVELIRVLLVFFLAGYFAKRWQLLRHVEETRPRFAGISRFIALPRMEFALPVFVCMAASLLFFFLQKDLGPALVFGCLFLALYGIARNSALLSAVGAGVLILGFLGGYLLGVPHTVSERVGMWLSPWNNLVHGGDQTAHGLWGFATGGAFGAGPGMGNADVIPAAHTDLILAALGEEWGFLGVAAVFGIYAMLVWRSLRIALRAASDYEFFLAAGLIFSIAMQALLIGGGVLGVLPLSGVVTPFLSFGRSSMLANFLVFAVLLSISARQKDDAETEVFRKPLRLAAIGMGVLALLIVLKAADVQVLRDRSYMTAGTLVMQADGGRRYEYNPRFHEAMREIPMGVILDRNGLPLATSDWKDLEAHREEFKQLGVDIDKACSKGEARHYPFGGLMFHLLGDLRTRVRWGAGNTSFVERDSSTRLRGYDERPKLEEVFNPRSGKTERILRYDYRELIPLIRYRYRPDHVSVRKILERKRDIQMSIDARLQVRAAQILQGGLRKAGKDRGAAVVLDPVNGDLLASVSLPAPSLTAETEDDANPMLDRARYGLYPPGSTFKIVTAMAALRANAQAAHQTYSCIRLPDGRSGNFIKGSNRPIRDDVQDKSPHGTIDLERATIVSCNAYYAQLGTFNVGAKALHEMASLLGIATASPNTPEQLRKSLAQSAYGQGQVVASPFQMARVAATVANGGAMPVGRWVTDETNLRAGAAQPVVSAEVAALVGKYMRGVVLSGTGRSAAGAAAPIAGKTGTAELADDASHAWFIGYAPYGAAGKPIAFSVLIENGQYGGVVSAPVAAEIVTAARHLGYAAGNAK